jgi:hypothetical protein
LSYEQDATHLSRRRDVPDLQRQDHCRPLLHEVREGLRQVSTRTDLGGKRFLATGVAAAVVLVCSSAAAAASPFFTAFGAGGPVAHLAFASISEQTLPADGAARADVIVAATDSAGMPVSNATLVLSASRGSFGPAVPYGLPGYYRAELTSSPLAGLVSLTASAGAVSASHPYLFAPLPATRPVSASASTMPACHQAGVINNRWACDDYTLTIAADDTDSVEVDLCLVGTDGQPLTSLDAQEITFHTSLGHFANGTATERAVYGGFASDPAAGTACYHQTLISASPGTATVDAIADGVELDATVQVNVHA